MRTRREKDDDQLDLDSETVTTGPVSFRREVRGGSARSGASSRRKVSAPRRKVSKPGGMHQRANKRMSW